MVKVTKDEQHDIGPTRLKCDVKNQEPFANGPLLFDQMFEPKKQNNLKQPQASEENRNGKKRPGVIQVDSQFFLSIKGIDPKENIPQPKNHQNNGDPDALHLGSFKPQLLIYIFFRLDQEPNLRRKYPVILLILNWEFRQ